MYTYTFLAGGGDEVEVCIHRGAPKSPSIIQQDSGRVAEPSTY